MLIKQLPATWWLIAAITLVSVVLVQFSGKTMLDPARTNRIGLSFNFLIGGIVFGLLAIQMYLWISGWSPANASVIYAWLAAGMTGVLTIAAFALWQVVKDPQTVAIWVALNIMWGAGYGWLIPRLVTV